MRNESQRNLASDQGGVVEVKRRGPQNSVSICWETAQAGAWSGCWIPAGKEGIVSMVTCSDSEQMGAGGGCLLKLGFFLILCPES